MAFINEVGRRVDTQGATPYDDVEATAKQRHAESVADLEPFNA